MVAMVASAAPPTLRGQASGARFQLLRERLGCFLIFNFVLALGPAAIGGVPRQGLTM